MKFTAYSVGFFESRLAEVLADPKLLIHQDLTVDVHYVLDLPKIGILRDNWRGRTIHMHGDSSALKVSKRIWTVGVWDTDPTITLAYESINLKYAIASEYWENGKKFYERN